MRNKPELLAPAGNLEKLKTAIAYGADAVYLGGRQFGLRAFADNFSLEEIKEGIDYAHSMHRKVYVTMNIFARNDDFIGMKEYIKSLRQLGVDAVILSDPGILDLNQGNGTRFGNSLEHPGKQYQLPKRHILAQTWG